MLKALVNILLTFLIFYIICPACQADILPDLQSEIFALSFHKQLSYSDEGLDSTSLSPDLGLPPFDHFTFVLQFTGGVAAGTLIGGGIGLSFISLMPDHNVTPFGVIVGAIGGYLAGSSIMVYYIGKWRGIGSSFNYIFVHEIIGFGITLLVIPAIAYLGGGYLIYSSLVVPTVLGIWGFNKSRMYPEQVKSASSDTFIPDREILGNQYIVVFSISF